MVKDWPALYILDACQSVGHIPLDVRAIGCDVLSASTRKYLRGPRGAGFFYVATEKIEGLIPPMLDGHAASWVAHDHYELLPDARRFENWEKSYANILGTGEAVALANRLGGEAIWNQISKQARKLRSALSDLPGVICTDIGEVQSGIVTFIVDGWAPTEIKEFLRGRNINVETSSVADTRFDMEARNLDVVVRSSVHYLTTDDEIDQLVSAISEKR